MLSPPPLQPFSYDDGEGNRLSTLADSYGNVVTDGSGQPVIALRMRMGEPTETLFRFDSSGNLLDLSSPAVEPAGIPLNRFDLEIAPDILARSRQAADLDAEAALVSRGLVASGGGWSLRTDPVLLNQDQHRFGRIDNTAAAAYTQILADGYRPGNGNLVGPVIDLQGNALGSGFYDSTPDWTGSWLNNADAWAQRTLPTDPLVLDLNGDGVRLSDYLWAPVLFDIDNDGGSLEQTGWASPEDGMVVADLDGNGIIDDISEILSEYFGGAAGQDGEAGEKRYRDGFAALRAMDDDGDGIFDGRDAGWSGVQVWIDANHDGKSWDDANGNQRYDAGEASELHSLASLGITQINLASQAQSGEVRDGNEVLARGTFVQDGSVREALAANFLSNPNGSVFARVTGGGILTQTEGGVNGSASAYVAAGSQDEAIDVAALGVHNAAGGVGDDSLTGDAGNNWLAGGPGRDRMDGGAGDDILLIDADDPQDGIQGGEGMDIAQVVGERGVTLNLAQAGIEIAQGGRGNDIFIGGGHGSVFMRGAEGDDILLGGLANDALSGEDGDDVLDSASGNDVLRGGRGRDRLLGGASASRKGSRACRQPEPSLRKRHGPYSGARILGFPGAF